MDAIYTPLSRARLLLSKAPGPAWHHRDADGSPHVNPDPTEGNRRSSRESLLEEENARLREALAQAGVDVEQLLAQAAGDTRQAPPAARHGEAGAGAPTLSEDLRRSHLALAASQAALSESQKRLHNLLAMDTLGVMVWGADLTLKEVNDAFLAMSGFTREEMFGLSWRQLTPEEFVPASLHAIDELETRGESTPYEKQ